MIGRETQKYPTLTGRVSSSSPNPKLSPLPSHCAYFDIACATDETKVWFSPSAKQSRNLGFGPPPVWQDLSRHHDWSVKNAIVDLPIRMKGNSKLTSCNSLSPLGAPEQGSRHCFADVTNPVLSTSATQARFAINFMK